MLQKGGLTTIQHQKILIGSEPGTESSPVRRYRASKSWPVGALALAAAAGAVLATGGVSRAFERTEDRPLRGVEAPAAMAPAAPLLLAPAPAAPSAAPDSASGLWQIQTGAFRSPAAAEAHGRALEAEVPALTRLAPALQARGGITKVRFGAIRDETAARALCARLAAAGHGCFVLAPGS